MRRARVALVGAVSVSLAALPVDTLLGDWASGTLGGQPPCDAELPALQNAVTLAVPLALATVALGCLVAGAVTVRRGRARSDPGGRRFGWAVMAVAVPSLVLACLAALGTFVSIALSGLCF
jgi:hypothetical protein